MVRGTCPCPQSSSGTDAPIVTFPQSAKDRAGEFPTRAFGQASSKRWICTPKGALTQGLRPLRRPSCPGSRSGIRTGIEAPGALTRRSYVANRQPPRPCTQAGGADDDDWASVRGCQARASLRRHSSSGMVACRSDPVCDGRYAPPLHGSKRRGRAPPRIACKRRRASVYRSRRGPDGEKRVLRARAATRPGIPASERRRRVTDRQVRRAASRHEPAADATHRGTPTNVAGEGAEAAPCSGDAPEGDARFDGSSDQCRARRCEAETQ